MNQTPIITISREYGSGGRAIGEKLAKELGIPFYNKELILMAAKESGLSEEYIKMVWGDPAAVDKAEQTNGGQGEAEIVESDNDNGENDTGGAV